MVVPIQFSTYRSGEIVLRICALESRVLIAVQLLMTGIHVQPERLLGIIMLIDKVRRGCYNLVALCCSRGCALCRLLAGAQGRIKISIIARDIRGCGKSEVRPTRITWGENNGWHTNALFEV